MDATEQVDPFTKLLAELNRRLTKLEEVKTLKHIVIGSPRVGKADIEDCDTGFHLFRKLQERHLITENDTKYLVEILDILGRKDLVQKVITYCEKNGKGSGKQYCVLGQLGLFYFNRVLYIVVDL